MLPNDCVADTATPSYSACHRRVLEVAKAKSMRSNVEVDVVAGEERLARKIQLAFISFQSLFHSPNKPKRRSSLRIRLSVRTAKDRCTIAVPVIIDIPDFGRYVKDPAHLT